jgi:hypothetical protein
MFIYSEQCVFFGILFGLTHDRANSWGVAFSELPEYYRDRRLYQGFSTKRLAGQQQ